MNNDNISLLDIQNEIFESIEDLLDEYEEKENSDFDYLDNLESGNDIEGEVKYELKQTFLVLKEEENKFVPSLKNEIDRKQETSFNDLFAEYSDVDMESKR